MTYLLQCWSNDTVCIVRRGAYLSRLTRLCLTPNGHVIDDDGAFLDVSALAGWCSGVVRMAALGFVSAR